jgi:hypothetical protein
VEEGVLWRNGCDGKALRCGAGERHPYPSLIDSQAGASVRYPYPPTFNSIKPESPSLPRDPVCKSPRGHFYHGGAAWDK